MDPGSSRTMLGLLLVGMMGRTDHIRWVGTQVQASTGGLSGWGGLAFVVPMAEVMHVRWVVRVVMWGNAAHPNHRLVAHQVLVDPDPTRFVVCGCQRWTSIAVWQGTGAGQKFGMLINGGYDVLRRSLSSCRLLHHLVVRRLLMVWRRGGGNFIAASRWKLLRTAHVSEISGCWRCSGSIGWSSGWCCGQVGG